MEQRIQDLLAGQTREIAPPSTTNLADERRLDAAAAQDAARHRADPNPRTADAVYGVIPRGDATLDGYSPAYWSMCFPILFPYGDACDGLVRRSFLSDREWARGLLLRAGRPL